MRNSEEKTQQITQNRSVRFKKAKTAFIYSILKHPLEYLLSIAYL